MTLSIALGLPAVGGASEPTVSASPATANPPLAVTGPRNRRTAAVVVKYTDSNPSAALTAAQARDAVFTNPGSPNKVYAAMTGGRLQHVGIRSQAGDVFGAWQLPIPAPVRGSCQDPISTFLSSAYVTFSVWLTGLARGVDLAQYDQVVVFTAGAAGCDEGGGGWGLPNSSIAFVGSEPVGLVGLSRIATHEVGHSLGLGHAMTRACEGTPFGPAATCAVDTYGDPYDVMGGREDARALNGFFRAQLGGIAPAQLQTTSATGTYRIHRLDAPGQDGTKLLMLPRPGRTPVTYCNFWSLGSCLSPGDAYLALEYRSQADVAGDGLDDSYAGVTARLTPSLRTFGSTLLVRQASGKWAAGEGVSFTDPAARRLITVDRITDEYADVRISGLGTSPPEAPVISSNSYKLTWNPVADDAGIASYQVFIDGGPGTGRSSVGVVAAESCASVCTFADFPPDRAVPSTRAQVVARDVAGNEATSNWVSIYEPDAAPSFTGLRAVADPDLNIRLTGQASLRAGLTPLSIDAQMMFIGSSAPRTIQSVVWQPSAGPWSSPLAFSSTFIAEPKPMRDYQHPPESRSFRPATLTITPRALYGIRGYGTSPSATGTPSTIPVEGDVTPPGTPTIELTAGSILKFRGTGTEPVDRFSIVRKGRINGGEYGVATATQDGELDLSAFPEAKGWSVWVVAYDSNGNWASSSTVTP